MPIATETRRPEPQRLPADLIDAPAAVRKALAAAVEAGRVLTEARTQQAAAKAAIAQADETDRAADTAAVAAGKPLPGAKAGQKAREAAGVAERRLAAAETNYNAAAERLMAVIGSNAEGWLEVLRKQLEQTDAEVTDSLKAFARAKAMRKALAGTITKAEEFVNGHDARLQGFPTTEQIERSAAEPDRIRDEVLRAVRGSRRFRVNESDIDRIVVELGLIAEGQRPWSESLHGSKDKDGPGSEGERAAAVFGGV